MPITPVPHPSTVLTGGAAALASGDRATNRHIWMTSASVFATMSYFITVLLLNQTVFGVRFRLGLVLATAVLIFLGTALALKRLARARPISKAVLVNVGLAAFVSLMCAVTIDIGAVLYRNWKAFSPTVYAYQYYYRLSDKAIWQQEFMPHVYYPTEWNFQLYKPGVSSSARLYGQLYSSAMRDRLQAADLIFEPHRISFSIDEEGLRNTTPLQNASIFALGDSFTFGYGVDQPESWVERLGEMLGVPIYNLGVAASSPRQQLMLLRYLLQLKGKEMHLRHLIWMIFAGNDLEDSYELLRPLELRQPHLLREVTQGTVLEPILQLPYLIQAQSVLYRYRTGGAVQGGEEKVVHQVYQSAIHGPKLFWEADQRCTSKTAAYVRRHPNRLHLEQTFREMAALSKQMGFAVTVVIAPCEERLYGQYFDGFPPAQPPYFIDFVEELSRQLGFDTVNLLPLLAPYAQRELLHFRDDGHWNPRGHEVASELLAAHLRPRFSAALTVTKAPSVGEAR